MALRCRFDPVRLARATAAAVLAASSLLPPAAAEPLGEAPRRTLVRWSEEGAVARLAPEGAVDAREGTIFAVWSRIAKGTPILAGQWLDGELVPAGAEVVLEDGPARQPDVALADGGGAWAAWVAGAEGRIVVRWVSPAGEAGLPRELGGDASFPALAGDGAVAWIEPGRARAAVAGRTVTVGEAAAGARLRHAAIVRLGEGYLVAWAALRPDGSSGGVHGRRLGLDGTAIGDVTTLVAPDDPSGAPIEPRLAAEGRGVVLTWMALGRGGYSAVSRRFGAGGRPAGDTASLASREWLSGARTVVSPAGRRVVLSNRGDAVVGRLGGGLAVFSEASVAERMGVATSGRQAAWLDERRLVMLTRAGGGEADREEDGDNEEDDDGGNDGPGGALRLAILDLDRIDPADLVEADDIVADGAPLVPVPAPAVGSSMAGVRAASPDRGFRAFEHPGPRLTGFPADLSLGVGPEHFVVTVNLRIRFFTKDGTMTYDADIHDFFGEFAERPGTLFSNEPQIWDPAVLYDPYAGRFVVSCLYTTEDSVLVAVSDDADPNGHWSFGRQDTSQLNDFIDFPNLGLTEDAYVVIPQFVNPPTSIWAFVVDKQRLERRGDVRFSSIQVDDRVGLNSGTRVYDPGAPYVWIRYWAGQRNVFLIQAITGAPNDLELHQVRLVMPAWSFLQNVPQGGTSERLRVITAQPMRNSVVRDGHLWAVHSVQPDPAVDQIVVRWYEIDLNGWPTSGGEPELVQTGDIDPGPSAGGNPVSAYIANLEVDADGNVGFVFSGSAIDQLITVYRAFRAAGDPPGTVRGIEPVHASTSPCTTIYGDYAGMQIDPADPGWVWSHGEYFVDTWEWETWLSGFPLADLAAGTAIDCAQVRRLKTTCKNHRLRAVVVSSLAAGTRVEVDNDGEAKSATIRANGRGKAVFRRQTGIHEVSLPQCPSFARTVDCGS